MEEKGACRTAAQPPAPSAVAGQKSREGVSTASRVAFALTLGLAFSVAVAAAVATAGGGLGDIEQGEQTSSPSFLGQRRLKQAAWNATGNASGRQSLVQRRGDAVDSGRAALNSSREHHLEGHRSKPHNCTGPCVRRQPSAVEERPVAVSQQEAEKPIVATSGHGDCPFGGHSDDQRPGHAGCFVVRDGRMLAIRLTYDGNRFDIPGGQTNWNEPARCTAYREALEETGYRVNPRELLAVVRGGFHIYRCDLVQDKPFRQHDHEVSWVGWLSRDEVQSRISANTWRFPEAHRYAEWLR